MILSVVILLILLSTALSVGLIWVSCSKKKMYRMLDELLDSVLKDEAMKEPAWKEGEAYALSYKMIRIREKLILEADRSADEKEQMKQLISNLSHQLKTPLANVMLYEEILLGNKNIQESEREKFLNQMKAQTEKIDWILNSLFQMVKLEQGVIEFAAGAYPIKRTLALALSTVYEKSLKKKIQFVMQDFKDRTLFHHPEWTAEVFVNLFENAIKYSPPDSRVEICVETYEMYSVIRVRDWGIGIPRHEQQKVFQRFYRGENAKDAQGSGIGLYLSKLIIEKEKGYLMVESEPGEGSCFQVFLQNRAGREQLDGSRMEQEEGRYE